MARHSDFIDFVLEQLAPLGSVRARAMFGGFSIYRGDTVFAIVLDDRLYLKTNDATRPEFEARGLGQFTYNARGKSVRLPYYEAPAEVFEEPESMCEWARRALAAASRRRTSRLQRMARSQAAPAGSRTRRKPRPSRSGR
jgi:DNA transformation protein